MKQAILTLSKKLIQLQSAPDNKDALETCLDLGLAELKDFTIERFEKDGVKSALVYNTPKRPKQFKILLNAHLDIIPGKAYQYTPQVEEDKLFGAGAMDMKANAACMILVFKEIAKKVDYPLALQLVTDEEIGGFKGTKYQIEKGLRTEFAIAGETTQFNIVNQSKGILWLKITAKGKSAHSAYPWNGKNAAWAMNDFLTKLHALYPSPNKKQWVTTVTLSKVETTNNTFNKIPDDCTASFDIRYVPEDNDVLKKIKKLMPKDFTMEIIANEPAHAVEKNNQFVKVLQKTTAEVTKRKVILYGSQGSSDIRHYAPVGGQGVEFGPIGDGIGSDNEWTVISTLVQYAEVLKKFLLTLSAPK